uniref:Lipid-binding serum glycoprotein N-terminal domain-containing protein n=1 Tax=Glossina brevipalpis TaxID=37001 RepID=A0A1A9WGV8_9MUSC
MLSLAFKCLLIGLLCLSPKAEFRENSINLVPMDPLSPKKIQLSQGDDSPVNIDITVTNSKIHGLRNAVATKVNLIGDYVIKGKVLILPIQGEGKSNITFVDVTINVDFTGTPVEKDDGAYMKLENFHLHVEPKFIIYKFDNLFNGDKALGDNMNKFLNENWKEIHNELRDSVDVALGSVANDVIHRVFTKYPYAKYFSE